MPRILQWLKKYEYLFALLIMLAGVVAAQWNILAAPNNLFPQTVDGMGHLAKIKYLADCIRDGVWPSWFPYWYTGATVIQYYPPLSYIWAVPAQLLTDNVIISFKWLTLSTMFLGSIGVWAICRRFVGPGAGLIAGLAYAFQPFLNRSLLISGTLAQAPVFALSPWIIYFSLVYLRSHQRKHWLIITVLTAALILSHAMHAFMVTMCVAVMIFVTTLMGYNQADKLLKWILAIVCAGGLTAFWSIPGVTSLENPGLPNLLPEATVAYTATLHWFSLAGKNSTWYYFSISLLLTSLLALLPMQGSRMEPKEEQLSTKLIWAIFLSFAFSIWLSFGHRWTLYSLIPMHQGLVPGRVLSYSSILGSILLGVLIYKLWIWNKISIIYRLFFVLLIMVLVFTDLNPITNIYTTSSYQQIQEDFQLTDPIKSADQGRFSWIWPCTSELSYFPFINGKMMADGWNIEGTPHNQAIWNHNIAIPAGCPAYITRNLLQWNVRSLFVSAQYVDLQNNLQQHGFRIIRRDQDKTIFGSLFTSGYIMQLKRNVLVMGSLADAVTMTYPWMIQDSSSNFEDYPLDLLSHFRVIYLINPKIMNMDKFESRVKELVNQNVMVIIEPGRFQPPSYFGIIPYPKSNTRATPLFASAGSFINIASFSLKDVPPDAPLLNGLDGVLLETYENDERCPVIGFKNIGRGRVYFVGLSLSEQLESTWIKSRGMESKPPNGQEIQAVLEKLFNLGQPYKDINPVAIPTSKINWRPDGFSFNYDSPTPLPAWISVTYTPRWQATIDGKEHPIYSLENLILLDLPAGKHTVNFRYGMTWVGILGIIITGITILIVVLLAINPRWLTRLRVAVARGSINTVRELFYQ